MTDPLDVTAGRIASASPLADAADGAPAAIQPTLFGELQ